MSCVSIKKILIAIAVIIILNAPLCVAQDANDAANSSARQAIGAFGSQDALRQNAVAPLTSDKKLYTLDGTNSGMVRLSCPSSNKFLTVLIQPAATNDLGMVNISQDTDLDGTVEYSYTLPFPVSGICANGVISCTPGTWLGCNYYIWVADANAHASVNQTQVEALGGCYCINNSCGSNLTWSNMANILKDLGGGVVGAVQAKKPQFMISSVSIDTATISYSGQDVKNCKGGSQASGSAIQQGPQAKTTQAQQYTNYAANMENATSQEVTSEQSDPKSYYNLLTQSAAAQQMQVDIKDCTIKRDITVQRVTNCLNGGVYSGSTDNCVINANDNTPQIIPTGGCNRGCYFNVSLPGGGGSSLSMGYGSNYLCGDPCVGTVKNGRIIYTCGGVQHIIYTSEYQTVTFPSCPTNDMTFVQGYYYTASSCSIDCSHYPNSTPSNCSVCAYSADKQDVLNESVNDQCRAIDSDLNCQLDNETVDSVSTYQNFQPSGLMPLPTCKILTGGFSPENVCRDWWVKDRTYQCKETNGYDFSDLKRRTGVIANSSTGDPNSGMTYSDAPRDANGNIINTSGSANLSQFNMSGNTCEQACKTKIAVAKTDAGASGNDSQYQNSATTYKFSYYKCKNNACPAGTGEQIIVNCQCINDFAEAVSILAGLNAASHDLICSSGAKQ